MTAEKKVARRKLSLLELAKKLNKVSKAYRVTGTVNPTSYMSLDE
ncbi:hypothetical protein [Rubritalea tangerina]